MINFSLIFSAEKYRHVFSNYKYFNKLQSKTIDTILKTGTYLLILIDDEKY